MTVATAWRTCGDGQARTRLRLRSWEDRSCLRWMRRMGRRLGAIALLAMLVRAVMPAGYMLADADTRVRPLSHGRDLRWARARRNAGDRSRHRQACRSLEAFRRMTTPTTARPPCVFAALSRWLSRLQPSSRSSSLSSSRMSISRIVRDLRPGRGIAAPPPPSTGPPSLI